MEGHDWSSHNRGKLPRVSRRGRTQYGILNVGRLWERFGIAETGLCVQQGWEGDDCMTSNRCPVLRRVCLPGQREILLDDTYTKKGVYGYSTVGKGRTTKAKRSSRALSPSPGRFSSLFLWAPKKKKKPHIRARQNGFV